MNDTHGLTLLLAFCALMDELLLARTVSLLAVDNAVWYALAVGLFIAGMGGGAWQAERHLTGAPWKKLFRAEMVLAFVGTLSVALVQGAALLARFGEARDVPGAVVLFFGTALLLAVLIGFFAGMELPLLMRMAEDRSGNGEAWRTGGILFADHLGSLAAGLVFPLLVLPRMDVLTAAAGVGMINAGAAGYLAVRHKNTGRCAGVAGGIILLALLLAMSPRLGHYFSEKYYFAFQDGGDVVSFLMPHPYAGHVDRVRSLYQLIDVVKTDEIGAEAKALASAYIDTPPVPGLQGVVFFLNGDFQFAADFERIYHETFAHVPVAAAGKVPQHVLVLGAGDGLLLRELLKYPEVRDITLVDIDAMVVNKIGRGLFSSVNENAFADPRVKVIVADAYQYVRRVKSGFDMVFCDFPDPVDHDLAKLYSREFYVAVRSLLGEKGVLVMDMPGLDRQAIWPVMNATLGAAGFKDIAPFFCAPEDDNAAALEALGGEQALLRNRLEPLQAGFLMAAPHERFFSGNRLLSTKGSFITERRLNLSLGSRNNFDTNVPGEINSVVRPVFPLATDRWKLRSAY